MPVIAVAATKGGSGRTTLSVNIADGLMLAGANVQVLDCDTGQWSASRWAQLAGDKPHPTVHRLSGDPKAAIAALATPNVTLIVDCEPRLSANTVAVMAAADLVLMPFRPSQYDVLALGETLTMFRSSGSKAAVLAVINAAKARTGLLESSRQAAVALGVPVADTVVHDRIAFAESGAGLSVLRTEPSGAAAGELRGLMFEILSKLKKIEGRNV